MSRGRGRLTADEIVEQAITILDAEGLSRLSMRQLGARLGVEAMSLYNYFPGKERLLDAIVGHLLSRIEVPDQSLLWKERVLAGFGGFRAVLVEHPNAIPLFVGPPRWTDRGLELAEEFLAVLHKGGLDANDSVRAHRILFSFTIGHAVVEVGLANEVAKPGPDPFGAEEALGGVDRDRFPELARMLDELTSEGVEDTFQLGLEMIIDGFGSVRAQ